MSRLQQLRRDELSEKPSKPSKRSEVQSALGLIAWAGRKPQEANVGTGLIPVLRQKIGVRSGLETRFASLPFLSNFEPSGRHLQENRSLAFGLRAFRPAEMLVRVFVEFFGR
jgi:hypothetical protein